MEFYNGSIGALGKNIRQLYGCLKFNKIHGKKDLFIMHTVKRNYDVIYMTSGVVLYYDINSRLVFFIYLSCNVVEFKTKVLKGRM